MSQWIRTDLATVRESELAIVILNHLVDDNDIAGYTKSAKRIILYRGTNLRKVSTLFDNLRNQLSSGWIQNREYAVLINTNTLEYLKVDYQYDYRLLAKYIGMNEEIPMYFDCNNSRSDYQKILRRLNKKIMALTAFQSMKSATKNNSS